MSFRTTMLKRLEKISIVKERLPVHYATFVLNDLKNRGFDFKRSQLQNFMNGLSWNEEMWISINNVADLMDKNLDLGMKIRKKKLPIDAQ